MRKSNGQYGRSDGNSDSDSSNGGNSRHNDNHSKKHFTTMPNERLKIFPTSEYFTKGVHYAGAYTHTHTQRAMRVQMNNGKGYQFPVMPFTFIL